ncbi:ATP/GTP-binding protein [Kutzneria buriramensis]|nr:ATP-binding protein [Kutzneria buriramensis]
MKIVILGGRRAGKTAFLRSISAPLPSALLGRADLMGLDAVDFVRVWLDEELTLHLVAAGGPAFPSTWHRFGHGAVGAVVLTDNRRLADAYGAIDFITGQGLPYVVAVNRFNRQRCARLAEVRAALNVGASVPVVACDPRVPASARRTLIALVEHTIDEQASHSRRLSFGL